MFRSFCSGLVLIICLSVLSMPAVSVLESVERISAVKPPVKPDAFAREYFAAFKATQLPGATKDNLEQYLALLYPSYLKMPASELSQRFQDKAHLRRNVGTFRTSVTQ